MDRKELETIIVKDIQKIDYKWIIIFVLTLGLAISFFGGQQLGMDYHKKEINALHKQNDSLSKDISRIVKLNEELAIRIASISEEININNEKITATELQLKKLNTKRNEIYNTVNNMSASDISDALSTYLEKK